MHHNNMYTYFTLITINHQPHKSYKSIHQCTNISFAQSLCSAMQHQLNSCSSRPPLWTGLTNSILYACGANSIFASSTEPPLWVWDKSLVPTLNSWFSYLVIHMNEVLIKFEPRTPIYDLQALTLSLGQVTSSHSEVVNTSLSQLR